MKFLSLLFSFFLFSTLFLACSSDEANQKKSAAEQRAELLNTIKNAENQSPPKQPARNLQELLDRIWELPKVKERAEYVKKETNGERKLKLKIQQKPTNEDPYYWVKVGEDNGMNFVSHFQFSIDPSTSEIFYYDELSGEKITVEEWNKVKEKP